MTIRPRKTNVRDAAQPIRKRSPQPRVFSGAEPAVPKATAPAAPATPTSVPAAPEFVAPAPAPEVPAPRYEELLERLEAQLRRGRADLALKLIEEFRTAQ